MRAWNENEKLTENLRENSIKLSLFVFVLLKYVIHIRDGVKTIYVRECIVLTE